MRYAYVCLFAWGFSSYPIIFPSHGDHTLATKDGIHSNVNYRIQGISYNGDTYTCPTFILDAYAMFWNIAVTDIVYAYIINWMVVDIKNNKIHEI